MDWRSFLIGLIIGWIAELVIDFIFWRRAQDGNGAISLADHEAQLAQAEKRIAELEASLNVADRDRLDANSEAEQLRARLAVEADCAAQLTAAASEIAALKAQLAANAEATVISPARTSPVIESTPPSPDDLKIVEGIGPKIEGILHSAGILTYSQLASADIAQLQGILAAAGDRYRLADPTTWGEQAALAAAANWDGLASLQDSLKGGRRTSSDKDENLTV